MPEYFIGLIEEGIHESIVRWRMDLKNKKIKGSGFFILDALLGYVSPNDGTGYVSISSLKEDPFCNISESTIKRHLRILHNENIIYIADLKRNFAFSLCDYEFNDEPLEPLLKKLQEKSYSNYLLRMESTADGP